MITATFRGHPIEVLDVFEGSSQRKLARIRYLDGHQSAKYSHGGWYKDNRDNIPVQCLRNVKHVLPECTCRERPNDYGMLCPSCQQYAAEQEIPY